MMSIRFHILKRRNPRKWRAGLVHTRVKPLHQAPLRKERRSSNSDLLRRALLEI